VHGTSHSKSFASKHRQRLLEMVSVGRTTLLFVHAVRSMFLTPSGEIVVLADQSIVKAGTNSFGIHTCVHSHSVYVRLCIIAFVDTSIHTNACTYVRIYIYTC
jgi:ABC-type transport system involved in Fe-S cluster assembly fused permease/ATPase subunit